jgi:hypothetical protein
MIGRTRAVAPAPTHAVDTDDLCDGPVTPEITQTRQEVSDACRWTGNERCNLQMNWEFWALNNERSMLVHKTHGTPYGPHQCQRPFCDYIAAGVRNLPKHFGPTRTQCLGERQLADMTWEKDECAFSEQLYFAYVGGKKVWQKLPNSDRDYMSLGPLVFRESQHTHLNGGLRSDLNPDASSSEHRVTKDR